MAQPPNPYAGQSSAVILARLAERYPEAAPFATLGLTARVNQLSRINRQNCEQVDRTSRAQAELLDLVQAFDQVLIRTKRDVEAELAKLDSVQAEVQRQEESFSFEIRQVFEEVSAAKESQEDIKRKQESLQKAVEEISQNMETNVAFIRRLQDASLGAREAMQARNVQLTAQNDHLQQRYGEAESCLQRLQDQLAVSNFESKEMLHALCKHSAAFVFGLFTGGVCLLPKDIFSQLGFTLVACRGAQAGMRLIATVCSQTTFLQTTLQFLARFREVNNGFATFLTSLLPAQLAEPLTDAAVDIFRGIDTEHVGFMLKRAFVLGLQDSPLITPQYTNSMREFAGIFVEAISKIAHDPNSREKILEGISAQLEKALKETNPADYEKVAKLFVDMINNSCKESTQAYQAAGLVVNCDLRPEHGGVATPPSNWLKPLLVGGGIFVAVQILGYVTAPEETEEIKQARARLKANVQTAVGQP